MFVELAKSEFDRCQPLMNRHRSIEVNAIISGDHFGRIFVDDRLNPKTGLIWLGDHSGFYLIGDEQNQEFQGWVHRFLEDYITLEALNHNFSFKFIGQHARWEPVIQQLFQSHHQRACTQQVYKLHSQNYLAETDPRIAESYSVHPITEAQLNGKTYDNNGYIAKKLLKFWPTVEAFFSQGFGFIVVHNSEVVSICFSAFVFDGVHAIEIETVEEHRGKSLAQKLAHTYVRACLERGIVPYWDCEEMNYPSVAIAEYLGFTKVFSYTKYEFPLKVLTKSNAL